MDVITHARLRKLIEAGSAPRVSIFMPTHRTGRDVMENPIRLKDLLREAEKGLFERGTDKRTVARILEPVHALAEDEAFWKDLDNGLAIFLADGFSEVYRMPLKVDEGVAVNDHFYVKPLLPMVNEKLFYILAVSLGDARLLACTQYRCQRLELPKDVAKSIKEAVLPGEDHDAIAVRWGGSPSNPASIGQGYSEDLSGQLLEDMMFYLRQLDDGIRRTIKDPDAPVILAGVDPVVPHYRKASSIRTLLDGEIAGNSEHVRDEQLAKQGVELLQPLWHKELNDQQERYGAGTVRGLSSNDMDEIVQAAEIGRVDVLFVPVGYAAGGPAEEHPEHIHYGILPGEDVDKMDQAITLTLTNSGTVVPILREEMPGNREAAAIFRYPTPQAAAS